MTTKSRSNVGPPVETSEALRLRSMQALGARNKAKANARHSTARPITEAEWVRLYKLLHAETWGQVYAFLAFANGRMSAEYPVEFPHYSAKHVYNAYRLLTHHYNEHGNMNTLLALSWNV